MTVRNIFVKGLEALIPKFSETYTSINQSLTKIIDIKKEAIKYIYLFALPVFVAIFIFADPVLRLWLRDSFDINIALAVRIFCVGWFLNLLSVPDYLLFIGIGKVKHSVMATCIKSFSNIFIITTYLLISSNLPFKTIITIESATLILAMCYLKFKYKRFIK